MARGALPRRWIAVAAGMAERGEAQPPHAYRQRFARHPERAAEAFEAAGWRLLARARAEPDAQWRTAAARAAEQARRINPERARALEAAINLNPPRAREPAHARTPSPDRER